jgi:hypothetical protein
MEQSNKELIKEIADLFEDYEESYVPGEWESFLKHKKKKYPFFPQWLKVAAVLLLIVSVLLFNLKDLTEKNGSDGSTTKSQNTVSVNKASGNKIKPAENRKDENYAGSAPLAKPDVRFKAHSGTATAALAAKEQVSGEKYVYPHVKATPSQEDLLKDTPIPNREGLTAEMKNQSAIQAKGLVTKVKDNAVAQVKDQTVAQSKAAPAKIDAKDTLSISPKRKLSTSEFMLAESKKASVHEKNKVAGSKWDFGVQVMPTATRTNINFGAGLVTAYRISNKLSLSSGISLLQLGSGENVPVPAGPGNALASPNTGGEYSFNSTDGGKQLQTVDARLKAIDIPLGLVYKVNKHYYTSAGISYFNVLSEKRSNTYSQTQSVSKTSTDPATGIAFAYRVLETQEIDEPAPNQPLKGNSYLGFFNFSIGRRQNIFKQYNIQIEPFIKVPIGKLSSQDLNLMNSGVKFQLSF